jgi:UDP-N-acetylglucosamine 4,6-dehydratase
LEKYQPRRVIIYSRDELKQFEMSRTFTSSAMRFFLGDVDDLPRLNTDMARLTMSSMPAALKQVPAAEYNPMECVKTNYFWGGKRYRCPYANGVKQVIALSTDKAA